MPRWQFRIQVYGRLLVVVIEKFKLDAMYLQSTQNSKAGSIPFQNNSKYFVDVYARLKN